MPQVIRVFSSPLTSAIFATNRYRDMGGGHFMSSGAKNDVTEEAIVAVIDHMRACVRRDCRCRQLQFRQVDNPCQPRP